MALSARLMMRQGQSLVMTPQLLQAIKLLQLSGLELNAYVESELEKNPLLERAEEAPEAEISTGGVDAPDSAAEGERDWDSGALEISQSSLESALDTDFSNQFDGDRSAPAPEPAAPAEGLSVMEGAWSGAGGAAPGSSGGFDEEAPNLEAYVAERVSLAEHLARQLALACADPVDRAIGSVIVDLVDEAGYFTGDIAEIAERLGCAPERVERVLGVVQTFEPSGVGARNLAECLAIQLREQDRFDPAMQALVANLPLLARRDYVALRKICGVDDEDLADMAAELRRLDPKPGRAFGGEPEAPVVADVFVRLAQDGSWRVELNAQALPRVLVNNAYAGVVTRKGMSAEDRSYVSGCLQSANWLTKSLEQRARTILKVGCEIVRQQDAFFEKGVEHLRPLNLRAVADAIGMHESTVSRVTSGKYLACPRGLFELKYFFSAAIRGADGAEAHSAEAVRSRIKAMIEGESADDVLSDDAIVARLRAQHVDIARRTVAKYRESLRIPSSIERRRERMATRAPVALAAQ